MSTQLQSYCLSMMGVVEWERRDRAALTVDYLLILDKSSARFAKDAILSKMLSAMGWEPSRTKKDCVLPHEGTFDLIEQRLSLYKPHAALVFGLPISSQWTGKEKANPASIMVGEKRVPTGFLPSLEAIIHHRTAKQQAWQIMKKLKSA